MLDSVKCKKTGDIYNVVCETYGSSGHQYTLIGKDGTKVFVSQKAFDKQYEPVEYPNLKEALAIAEGMFETSSSLRRAIYPIMRRLHPGGYFRPGDLVFLNTPFPMVRDNYSHDAFTHGEITVNIFIVVSVSEDVHRSRSDGVDESIGQVGISHWKGPGVPLEKYDYPDISIPIHKDKYATEDAYFYLQRFDQPY